MKKVKKTTVFSPPTVKLDFGCGPNKREGFIGVDAIKFKGVDVVLDIANDKWPWKDGSVNEAHASHFVEHLTAYERVHFVNELYRVLEADGKFSMVVPHWASQRAYGDPTHQWPPVSEFWFYYLNKEWRKANAPHTDHEFNKDGFNCDFLIVSGYSMREDIVTKNEEMRNFALQNYKEVALDLIAHFTKK